MSTKPGVLNPWMISGNLREKKTVGNWNSFWNHENWASFPNDKYSSNPKFDETMNTTMNTIYYEY